MSLSRDLMKQMEKDLESRLDWIAVDHHNTGHAHTHIIVRGVLDDGRIHNIAGDYIAMASAIRLVSWSLWNWVTRARSNVRPS